MVRVYAFGLYATSAASARRRDELSCSPALGRGRYTATVSEAVKPSAALPLIVASSSDDPSLKTLSEASVTWAALRTPS
jgi:hypothetical protein